MSRLPQENSAAAELRDLDPALARLREHSLTPSTPADLGHLLALAEEAVAQVEARANAPVTGELFQASSSPGVLPARVVQLSPKPAGLTTPARSRTTVWWAVAASLLALVFFAWPEREGPQTAILAEDGTPSETSTRTNSIIPAAETLLPETNTQDAVEAGTAGVVGSADRSSVSRSIANQGVTKAGSTFGRSTSTSPAADLKSVGSSTTPEANGAAYSAAADALGLSDPDGQYLIGDDSEYDVLDAVYFEGVNDAEPFFDSADLAYYYSPAELSILAWATGDDNLDQLSTAEGDGLPW